MMNALRVHLAAVVVVAALGACATATKQTTPPDRVLVTTDAGTIRTPEGASSDSTIDAPPDSAFAALMAAYQDLGIDVKLLNPQTREIGNRRFAKIYDLAGMRMSKYVGCGSTETGPAADNYRITMSIVSRVSPSGTGSRIDTQMTAYAEDLGSSKGAISCTTLGVLEQRIHAQAVKHLASR
jgi:hypothetical protein